MKWDQENIHIFILCKGAFAILMEGALDTLLEPIYPLQYHVSFAHREF
jgi:hypothetical protein